MDVGWDCPPHHHDCTEIVFCFDCSGVLHFRKQRYEYRDADLIVCRPGETHWVTNAHPGRQVCFGMDGAGAETIPSGVYRSSEDLLVLRDKLVGAFMETGDSRGARIDLLCGLVAVDVQESLGRPTDLASKTDQVKALIESRYVEEWDTTTLAYSVGLSPDYLRHAFRNRFGVSVARYLQEVRLKTAARILQSTDDPVRQVARLTGFRDPAYLAKVFRRELGMSPLEYRRLRRSEPDPAVRYDRQLIIGDKTGNRTRPVTPDLQSFLVNGDAGVAVGFGGAGSGPNGDARE